MAARQPASEATDVAEEHRVDDTGRYRLLSKYLRDRYANRVVLTFGEIEDLVGFPLPESARDAEWWGGTNPDTPRTPQSDAWRLASRTAVVNLPAQRVVFDRQTANRRPATQ